MSPNNINICYTQIQFLQRIGNVDEAYKLAIILRKKIIGISFKHNNKMILNNLNKFITSYELQVTSLRPYPIII